MISPDSTTERKSSFFTAPGGGDSHSTTRGKIRILCNFIVLVSGSLFLVFHFLVIAFSLAPDNPLKHQYKIQIARYMAPLFSQTWNLFSPNPINSNMTVLLQFKVYKQGRVDATPWVDIMQPLVEHRKEHFWSPTQRISKFLTSCMQDILENRAQTLEFIAKDDSLSRDSVAAAKLYNRLARQWFGHKSIMQYARHVFRKINGTTQDEVVDSIFVAYKIFESKFPRFSKRQQDYFELKNYQFTEYQSAYQLLNYRMEKP